MQDFDPIERKLQRIGGDLRQRGLEPLPQHRRADIDTDGAVLFDDKPRVLFARTAAFNKGNRGEPVIAAVDETTLQRFLLGPADLAERALEGCMIIAGVEFGFGLVWHELARGKRKLRLRDQVLAPELHRIEAEFPRHDVEQAFAEEICFEAAGRAQGPDRGLAGHHRVDGERDIANTVRPRQKLRGLGRYHTAVGADVGAHVGVDMAAHAEDGPIALACDLELAIDFARMVGCGQVLAAVFDPFHRPTDMAGCERDEKILRVEFAAHAKTAANVDLDHVDGIFADAQHWREHAAVEEQNLGGAENRQPGLTDVPFCNMTAGLERQSGQAVTAKAFPSGVLGIRESRIGVSERRSISHRAIAAGLFKQQRLDR